MQLPTFEQRRFFEQAVSQYQRDLAAATSAQAYLRTRGIGPAQAAQFRLGLVMSPLAGHEGYTGRLVIPYLDPVGVVTLRFRCVRDHVCKDEGCPKYLGLASAEARLYNVLDFKKDVPAIYICEGEIDTLSLSMCGYAAIGMPGVKAWKKWFTPPFKEYTQVFCVADGDKAGRGLGTFLANEVDARPIHPPEGRDINSLYSEGGVPAVQAWLAGAVT